MSIESWIISLASVAHGVPILALAHKVDPLKPTYTKCGKSFSTALVVINPAHTCHYCTEREKQ